jgi:shikimate dehydrogenase
LLQEAQAVGCTTIDGLGMVIHQGIASFEIWTGQTPPVEPLRQIALDQFNKRTG